MLDPTRQKFVESTLRGNGPKQAAIDAGLSEKTAASAGSRLRKDPKIVAALAAIGFATPGAPPAVKTPDPVAAVPADQEPEDDPLDDLPQTGDSLEFLEAVQANPRVPLGRRIEVAKALLPFQHAKIGEKGKKETKADGAKEAAKGDDVYGTRKPPSLKAVN